MNTFRKISAFCILGMTLALYGCEDQGPAEETGERIDEAIEKTGEHLEEAGEKIKDTVEDASDELQRD